MVYTYTIGIIVFNAVQSNDGQYYKTHKIYHIITLSWLYRLLLWRWLWFNWWVVIRSEL